MGVSEASLTHQHLLFHFINRECDKTIQHGHYFLQQEHKVLLSGFTIQLFIKIFLSATPGGMSSYSGTHRLNSAQYRNIPFNVGV